MNATNEIILSTANAPAKFSFKNEKLNTLSSSIAAQTAAMNKLYNDTKQRAEAINSALAPIFGEILESKCYKDDGFKSVADYAECTFGIGKSMAYMLARVGKEYYNAKGAVAKAARETLTVSKLGELTGVDLLEVGKALDSGELSSQSSLAECRRFAESHKNSSKEKVVPMFNLYVVHPSISGGFREVAKRVTKDNFPSLVGNETGIPSDALHFVNVAIGDSAKTKHFVAVADSGMSYLFRYVPYVHEPEKREKKAFDLDAYIASLSPEERETLAKKVKGE